MIPFALDKLDSDLKPAILDSCILLVSYILPLPYRNGLTICMIDRRHSQDRVKVPLFINPVCTEAAMLRVGRLAQYVSACRSQW